jgi:ABC-type Fe3+ transport system substrate-binding protein
MYYLAQVNTLTVQWDDQNLPSDYVVPEPILIEQQGTAVMASAPHPAAAALLSGWLASPEGVAIRKRVAYTADLLPDSNDELARELRSRGTEIVYDTPATTGLRGELAAAIQPLIGPEYNFYERNAQPRSTTFPSTPASPTAIIGQAIEELMRKLQSVPD